MLPHNKPCTDPVRPHRHHITILLLLLLSYCAQNTLATPSTISVAKTNSLEIPDTQIDQAESASIRGTKSSSPDLALPHRDQQTPGLSCPGSEGQWNCMTNSWQRCAAGRWSLVMQCAAGTACVPSGLTYDFKVQFSGQGTVSRSSALRRKQLVWPLLLTVAGAVTASAGLLYS